MPVPYDFESAGRAYKDYYSNQHGNGVAVFRGVTTQRGHGIGGLLSGLLKGAMPLLKSGAKSVGKELLSTGFNVARDVAAGRSLGESAKSNFAGSGRRLMAGLAENIPSGSARRAPKRKRRPTKRNSKKRSATILDRPFRR